MYNACAENDGKRYTFTRSGIEVSYGLVLGIKPSSLYSKGCSEEIAKGLIRSKTKRTEEGEEITQIYVDPELQDEAMGNVLRCLCGALNKHQNYLVSFHNAFTDPTCSFHGYHWHVMVEARVHPTRDARWGRDISTMSRCTGVTYISCEVANNREALTKHVATAPRVVLAVRGQIYNEILLSAPPAEMRGLELSPDWQGARLREDANYHRIVNLVKLMDKYQTPELVVLKQKLKQVSPKDWSIYVQLMCMPSFDNIAKKAIELFKTEQMTMEVDKRFGRKIEDPAGSLQYLNIQDSCALFEKWCVHNDLKKNDVVDEIFDVLSKRIKKKNTFMLEGPANCGKSYIIRSIVPYYIYWGEVHGGTGANFQWMGCIDTSLIVMEEPMLTPETIEQAKLVFEGAPTMVNIKCKGPQLLQPTPVLITSNNPIWKWASSNREAMEVRMFHHNCKPFPLLKEYTKGINPDMWRQEFELYRRRHPKETPKRPIEEVEIESDEEIDALDPDNYPDPMRPYSPDVPDSGVEEGAQELIYLDPREAAQKVISKEEYESIIITQQELRGQIRDDQQSLSQKDLFVPDTPPSQQKKKSRKN
uniref:Nonstructural protein n=1 Tax=Motacilla cinerea parvoviridae sp. TaxID=2794518 RepID=A0A8A4XCI9_9VIRU|nr:MAG: nonstructural protein [Motacilla cinerea parvoviridae sp.]